MAVQHASEMSEQQKDDLFAGSRDPVEPFRFDASVARVFSDMVNRSVPGYGQLVDLTGLVGARFVRPGTRCYDLGCSLGAITFSLLARTPGSDARLVAVDKAPAMIEALADRLRGTPEGGRVETLCADLLDLPIENASLVVLNLTLQFIPPQERLGLLRRIRQGLVPGAALILSEKVRFADAAEQRLLTALHEDYKRANGYSEMEISRKRAALDRVLVPDTLEQHLRRLKEAGFDHVTRWFQGLNFVSLLAWT